MACGPFSSFISPKPDYIQPEDEAKLLPSLLSFIFSTLKTKDLETLSPSQDLKTPSPNGI